LSTFSFFSNAPSERKCNRALSALFTPHMCVLKFYVMKYFIKKFFPVVHGGKAFLVCRKKKGHINKVHLRIVVSECVYVYKKGDHQNLIKENIWECVPSHLALMSDFISCQGVCWRRRGLMSRRRNFSYYKFHHIGRLFKYLWIPSWIWLHINSCLLLYWFSSHFPAICFLGL
jgi:hypothetical protein